MPTSLNEAAYNLLNQLRGGRSFNNEHISLRQIKYNLLYYRSTFIRRDVQRGRELRGYEQSLPLVEMHLKDPAEATRMDLPQFLLQSQSPLPARVRLQLREGISYVGPPSLEENIPVKNYHNCRHLKYRKYTGSERFAFLLDDYLYVTGDPYAETISDVLSGDQTLSETPQEVFQNRTYRLKVRGVFEDPYEAANFEKDDDLIDHDDPCPAFPLDLVQRITRSLLDGEMQLILQTPTDTYHDNLPDTAQQPQD